MYKGTKITPPIRPSYIALFLLLLTLFVEARAQDFKAQGDRALATEAYTDAIRHYRKHLKANPKDSGAKVLMAVAYLYSGEPERSLVILKANEDSAPSKALNFFHQALAHNMMGDRIEADKAFVQAARFQSKYGDWSIYELAVRAYEDRDATRVKYWADLSTQRYPSGKFVAYAKGMLNDARLGQFNSEYPSFDKPTLTESTMKFHPYSFSKTLPHFWYWLYGYHYTSGSKKDPTSDESAPLKEVGYSKHALMMHFGAGLGPLVKNNSRTQVGYLYRQNWLSDDERITDYFKGGDPVEYLTYLPFRADLLERQHIVFVDTEIDFTDFLLFKLYAAQRYTFMGARLIPGPEGDSIDQNATLVKQGTDFQPRLRVYNKEVGMELYAMMNKSLNNEIKAFSSQTYSLTSSTPVLSGGILVDYTPSALEDRLRIDGHIILHDFIFNDYYNDYTRQGFVLGVNYQVNSSLSGHAELGVIKDDFKLSIPRQSTTCSGASVQGYSENPLSCKRQTDLLIARAGFAWNYGRFKNLFADVSYLDVKSDNFKADDRSEFSIIAGGSFSFPESSTALKMERDVFDATQYFIYD